MCVCAYVCWEERCMCTGALFQFRKLILGSFYHSQILPKSKAQETTSNRPLAGLGASLPRPRTLSPAIAALPLPLPSSQTALAIPAGTSTVWTQRPRTQAGGPGRHKWLFCPCIGMRDAFSLAIDSTDVMGAAGQCLRARAQLMTSHASLLLSSWPITVFCV